MHITNVMFSRGLGGIEQACLDYAEAIQLNGAKSSVILHPKTKARQSFEHTHTNRHYVRNLGQYDIFAQSYLCKILKQLRPDAVIAHGNRAIALLKRPCKKLHIPLFAVTHNYSTKRMHDVDGVLCITEQLRQHVIHQGIDPKRCFNIPNMIRLECEISPSPPPAFRDPPIIGTMGRFVQKKGFHHFIDALAILKQRNIPFHAIIGGTGNEEQALRDQATSHQLADHITFSGWVDDKRAFFESIDVFCLPSIHEPFGIVLLEALKYGKPVVSTDSEGPDEILTHGNDALICHKNNPESMADMLELMLNDEAQRHMLIKNSLTTVQRYDIHTIGKEILSAVKQLI